MMTFSKPTPKSIIKAIGVFLIPVLFYCTFKFFGIILTTSGSIPPGFYQIIKEEKRAAIEVGSIASFCLPDEIAAHGLERGYINKGDCKNGSEELIKMVIAKPGDHVELKKNEIVVTEGQVTHFYYAPIAGQDKNKLPIKIFTVHKNMQSRGYWVYGFNSPKYSWDSRYYGDIPENNITHILKPLWIF